MCILTILICTALFLSTLSLRRATDESRQTAQRNLISIHALLAESDRVLDGSKSSIEDFYPRSPCGERPGKHAQWPTQPNFYPRSPCGERPMGSVKGVSLLKFLSTLSLRRATTGGQSCNSTLVHFYPRSPCGERR